MPEVTQMKNNIFLSQAELEALERVIVRARAKPGVCYEPVIGSNCFCSAVKLDEGIQFSLIIPPNTCILRGILLRTWFPKPIAIANNNDSNDNNDKRLTR